MLPHSNNYAKRDPLVTSHHSVCCVGERHDLCVVMIYYGLSYAVQDHKLRKPQQRRTPQREHVNCCRVWEREPLVHIYRRQMDTPQSTSRFMRFPLSPSSFPRTVRFMAAVNTQACSERSGLKGGLHPPCWEGAVWFNIMSSLDSPILHPTFSLASGSLSTMTIPKLPSLQ